MKIGENKRKQAGAELCQAQVKLGVIVYGKRYLSIPLKGSGKG